MSATPQEKAHALPSGTVTFAFTDVEGSTERWERDRAAMQAAIRRHDELMRAAIATNGGHVFKTIGDAFCAAFARPEDAVVAMLDAQQVLAAEDFSAVGGLRVRAAIHTGTADERDGDYFGPPVNRVARLLAIGHGGQVLVSGATGHVVASDLPAQAGLRDLGAHRLRDLAQPEHVYQLLAPGLTVDFPSLRSLNALPNNLPVQLTSFIGREKEIADITALIQKHRLVTLVGTGGVGKTRTSLQVAANLLDGSGDGVWLIELAPLASGDYIPSTIAQAMGMTLPADGDPLEHLVRVLKRKHMLLVFDNCEHLVEPAAHVVAAILSGCPGVNFLVSGRQALEIAGEETYRLPILDVPRADGVDRLRATEAMQSAAIALFVDRALSVDKRFTLTDENAPIVAEICRRLDGIPLAIELAASRVKMFTPQQVRERLNERFRMLTGGSRDVLPRQKTLRALIDWSHDLLDERERALFRRLAVFVNGFTFEGAVAVGSGNDLDEYEIFDILASLVDKSLVIADPQAEAVRYRLLESTRAYASEKLGDAGDREILAARHLHYLRDRFAASREVAEKTTLETDLDTTLTVELEDVRAALDVAPATDVVAGGELLAAIGRNWQYAGLEREGIGRIEAYVDALPGDEASLAARLLIGLTTMLTTSGRRLRAFEAAARAIALARVSGDLAVLSATLERYSSAAVFLGRLDEAVAPLEEAETVTGVSVAARLRLLRARADLNAFAGNLDEAVRTYERLRKEYTSLGDTRGANTATGNLAELEHERGETQRAIALLRETLTEDSGNTNTTHLSNLTAYLVAIDDLAGAEAAAGDLIRRLVMREPDDPCIAVTLGHLALVRALQGDLPRAAAIEGFTDAAFQRHGFEREATETITYDRLMAMLRAGLAPDELTRLLAEGAALAPEAAIALALESSDR